MSGKPQRKWQRRLAGLALLLVILAGGAILAVTGVPGFATKAEVNAIRADVEVLKVEVAAVRTMADEATAAAERAAAAAERAAEAVERAIQDRLLDSGRAAGS
ncbi:MAG: hypothetical protein EA406_05490 [Rhodospirillales bacterium]|nr:MAG: hypothetical protein EA406_05490 [Rhodospirillales bacterium]